MADAGLCCNLCLSQCFLPEVRPVNTKKHVKCMWEQRTCSKWQKTGVVSWVFFVERANRNAIILTLVVVGGDNKLLSSYNNGYNCISFLSAAGNAFCQAARLNLQMENKLDAAINFIDAGNAFKKADPQGIPWCFTTNRNATNYNVQIKKIYIYFHVTTVCQLKILYQM